MVEKGNEFHWLCSYFYRAFLTFQFPSDVLLIYNTRQSHYNFTNRKSYSYLMDLQIISVIEALLGADNERRIQAEKFIDQISLTSFDQGIDAFVQSMNNENAQISTMGALLLKKKYLDDTTVFSKISSEKLEFLVSSVKNMILPEKSLTFLKRCCEILVKVFTHIKQERELIQIITTLSSVDSLNIKLAMMYLIEIICEYSFDDKLLMEYSSGFESIFQKGLEDKSTQVKVSAFKTLTVFLSSISKLELVMKFSSVLNILLQKSIQLIKFDQQSGITALESLNELIEAHPKFVKPILNDMLTIYVQIMEAEALLVNLRTTAMHGVYLLANSHAAAVKKAPVFKFKYVGVYMKMLSEIHETSVQEWANEFKDEIISKNDISLSTEEHLSQMMEVLGNKFMLPLFISQIQEYLKSDQPHFQHAGLTCMSILTENCHESYKGELKNIFGLILPLLNTTNPRLIVDIVVAMGYMSQEFAPQIQQNYGDLILGFICKCLQHNYPKVQYKGALCIQNFETGLAEHKDKEIKVMDKYIDQILASLGKIFENSLSGMSYIMLEAILDTISTIAQYNSFDRFYPTFMPGLKKIISIIGTDTQQKIMIRSKTIETMGHLLYAIRQNPTLFNPESEEIMKSLLQIQQILPEDDLLHKSLFVVYENVVQCMKQNFNVYSDQVFHFAYLAAARKVYAQILNEYETPQEQENKSMNRIVKLKLDLKIEGVKNIILNTDHLTQKIEASVLIVCMAEFMGSKFLPYVEKTIPLVSQLMVYKHSREIRNNAIETIKYMVLNCPQQEQKLQVLKMVWQPFLNELATVIRGQDYKQVGGMIETLAETMPAMDQQMSMRLPQICSRVIAMVNTVVKSIEEGYNMQEMDEEQQDRLADDTAEVQQVLEHIETIIDHAKGQAEFENLKKFFPSDYEFGQQE